MAKKRQKLPATLYVRIDHPENGDAWFSCEDTLEASLEDDGPDDVGVYRLVEVKRVRKTIQIQKATKA